MNIRSANSFCCIIIYLFILPGIVYSQDYLESQPICILPLRQKPLYPGCGDTECGNTELKKYFKREIQFENLIIEYCIEGRCYAQFKVNLDGTIEFMQIHRSLHPSYDQSIINAINNMNRLEGKWTPGRLENLPQVMYLICPIDFCL